MAQYEDDEPLSPEVEAIRKKMVRLLMVSGGIMMLGLMAVLAAIVYKIKNSDVPDLTSSKAAYALTIPAGAQIITSHAQSNNVSITLKLQNGSMEIRRYDGRGNLLSTYSIIEK